MWCGVWRGWAGTDLDRFQHMWTYREHHRHQRCAANYICIYAQRPKLEWVRWIGPSWHYEGYAIWNCGDGFVLIIIIIPNTCKCYDVMGEYDRTIRFLPCGILKITTTYIYIYIYAFDSSIQQQNVYVCVCIYVSCPRLIELKRHEMDMWWFSGLISVWSQLISIFNSIKKNRQIRETRAIVNEIYTVWVN